MDFDPREVDEYLDLEEQPPKEPKRPLLRPLETPESIERDEVVGRVITYDDMRKALSRLLRNRGMSQQEINELSMYLLSFFGFSDIIIDNILDTDDRDVFYMLEEEGLLSTSREESYTIKGKVWRIHYWVMRKREIMRLCKEADEERAALAKKEGEFAVYDDVDPRVWAREE